MMLDQCYACEVMEISEPAISHGLCFPCRAAGCPDVFEAALKRYKYSLAPRAEMEQEATEHGMSSAQWIRDLAMRYMRKNWQQ